MAQKAGFEPALPFSDTTPLAGEPLEPLGYFCMFTKFFSFRISHHSIKFGDCQSIFPPKCKKNKKFFAEALQLFKKYAKLLA